MLRASCVVFVSLIFSGGLVSAGDDSPLGTNAALKYWQAFATLPKLTDAEQKVLIKEFPTMPLDAHARELVTSAEYSLRMMYRGAAVRPCDWGIGWKDDGAETRLPQLSAARVLTALASLRARMSFEKGRPQAAVDDIVAALTLGRQVSLDGSLIGVITGYAIEAHTYDALAIDLPRLNADTLNDLKSRLAALPPGGRPALAIKDAEENTVEWIGGKVKETKDVAELQKLLIDLGLIEGKDQDKTAKARALVEECGGNKEGFLQRLDDMRSAYALISAKLDLPLERSEKEFESVTKGLEANPLYKLVFPSALACRRAQARTDIRRSLLAAAIDIQLNGRDALKNHPDPVTGAPFELTAFDGGYELRSSWQQKPAPLTLTVGRRGK